MTMDRSFARVDAVISSLLLLTVYVWYRGGGLQAAATPAQDDSPPAPVAKAPRIEAHRDVVTIPVASPLNAPDSSELFADCASSKPAVKQPSTPSAPKAVMPSSKVLVPGFSEVDTGAISKSIDAARAWPKSPARALDPPARTAIMSGSKSGMMIEDLNAKEVEGLRRQLARVQAEIAVLESRAASASKPIQSPVAAPYTPPAARKTIMYSSKSGMIVPPPEPQSQTHYQVKAATQWTRQQSASQGAGN